MIPSLYPLYDFRDGELRDGSQVAVSVFCAKAMEKGQCQAHYKALQQRPEGYYQCPFGFTTRTFLLEGRRWAFTGVIAHPRFGSEVERRQAKDTPQGKVARASMDQTIQFLREAGRLKAQVVQEGAKVLPQAFHELRKLNRAVLQHAEKEISEQGETRHLRSIVAAAELMRNNFDILEALANVEGIRALPMGDTINLFDLGFKTKRIHQEKASEKGSSISVNGPSVMILGSQKSFPMVPAVLVENAIKYGSPGRHIRVNLSAEGQSAVFAVENETDLYIDPVRCFDHGERFADKVEGGGFGLFLAKEIVEAHGGKIRCELIGRVVRMIVELPLHKVLP